MTRALSEFRRRWWASLTPEQREAHKLKQRAGAAVAFAKRREQAREYFRRLGLAPPQPQRGRDAS